MGAQQNHKLIASKTGNRVSGLRKRLQTRSDVHQQLIADIVPQGIVDHFEVVQIDEKQSNHLLCIVHCVHSFQQ